jgi:hypothetical protein
MSSPPDGVTNRDKSGTPYSALPLEAGRADERHTTTTLEINLTLAVLKRAIPKSESELSCDIRGPE